MLFHASGSFAVIEQSERRLPPLRSVLTFGEITQSMKTLVSLLMFTVTLLHCRATTNAIATATAPQEHPTAVIVSGIGGEWYTVSALEQIARDYAKQKKVDFDFAKTDVSVWIHTEGSNIVARVSFSSGFGRPIYMADIDRSGRVATNYIGIFYSGPYGRMSRVHDAPQ